MHYPEILTNICKITAAIFECDPATLNAKTRLMIDLPCESIDLLEIGVSLNRTFGVAVDDETVFLSSLRFHATQTKDVDSNLARIYPHLSPERLHVLAREATQPDSPPQLCLGDIAAYIHAALNSNGAVPNLR